MRAEIFLAVIMLVSICLFAFSGDTEEEKEVDAQPILIEHYDGMNLYAQPLNDGSVMYFYEIRDGDCVRYRIISSASIDGSFKPNF